MFGKVVSGISAFLQGWNIQDIINGGDLPNKEELIASGFLEKRSAIATITDLARDQETESIEINSGENFQENIRLQLFIFLII